MDAPHYFFKEGNIIPGIKERDQTDKVKSKGKKKDGGAVPRQGQPPNTAASAPGVHGTDTPSVPSVGHGRTADKAKPGDIGS